MRVWFAIMASIHVLAAAVWMGSMFYSLVVLHPRARRHFQDVRQFEDLIAALAHGARYPVLAAFAIIGATGLALIPGRPPASQTWWVLIVAKIVLFGIALGLFWYVSYRLWPSRVFASDDELPAHHRRFRVIAVALTAIATAAIVLGVLAHLF